MLQAIADPGDPVEVWKNELPDANFYINQMYIESREFYSYYRINAENKKNINIIS